MNKTANLFNIYHCFSNVSRAKHLIKSHTDKAKFVYLFSVVEYSNMFIWYETNLNNE